MDNNYIDAYDCLNLTVETNVLHLAVNEDKKDRNYNKSLLDHAVLLPSYHYHDNLEQYDKQEALTAMKKEMARTTDVRFLGKRLQLQSARSSQSTTALKFCRSILGVFWIYCIFVCFGGVKFRRMCLRRNQALL